MAKGSNAPAAKVTMPDRIVMLPIGKVSLDPRNARTHSEGQVAQLAAAIKEFGWTIPILVDGKRQIIAGEGRYRAAQLLGLSRVPCIEARHLTPAQRRAYALADNQIALNAGWDVEKLRAELVELKDSDFRLDLTGFSEASINDLLKPDADPAGGGGGGGGYAEQFGVIVVCKNEQEQQQVFERLTADGLTCRVVTT